MSNVADERSVQFRHLVLEGTSFDVGKSLGLYISSQMGSLRSFTSKNLINDYAIERHINQAINYFDKYCPEINDEVKGIADGLGISIEKLMLYIATYKSKGCCSQLALLPQATKDGHTFVARNYEYWPEESDLCLITAKVKGKAKHIGFSELLIGRNDGINEYGLCISMSNAAPGKTPDCEGFDFWVIIRAVLDQCKTIEEAVELIYSMPTASYTNFIVADRGGNAALIEVAGTHKVVQKISNKSKKQYLHAANHFISPEMQRYDIARYWDSVARYTAMSLRINEAIPYVDKELIKGIQSDLAPLGICCHHYASRFGTLWSAIYDVTDISLKACFGSPRANLWYSFDLNSTGNVEKYAAILPYDRLKPTWKKLPPGANDCSEFEIV